ncbi:MAG TPA: ATP-binding protein [Acetobacteraceae bacterium]|nr:ATP-binding protein [Acetobacteraceae bacterium]
MKNLDALADLPVILPDLPYRRAGRGVRTYLLAVVISSLLPLALFAGYLSYDSSQSQRETIRTSILSTTRALAVAVDEHIRVRREMLEQLGRSEALRSGDLIGFHAEMVRLSQLLGGTIITLVRPDGSRALFSTLPPGETVPGTSNMDLVRRVFESGQAQVSDVFVGALVRTPLAVLAVPVRLDDRVAYSLQLTLNPDDFIRLLRANDLPDTWISGIVDRTGRFLARVPDNDKRVGQLASEGWREAIHMSPDESWGRLDALEGQPVYNGHSRARESGFIVGIGVPAAVIEAPLRQSLWRLFAGGCVVVLLGATIAALVARRLTDGLQRVAIAAVQVPVGRCDAPQPTKVREIDQIATALTASAQTILRRTEERDQADRAMRETADELRRLNETLEQRIAGEIAQRMRVEAALRQAQKMEAIGQLTGGIAHDFNNLLQVIGGNLEAMRMRLAATPDLPQGERLRRYSDFATQAAEKAAALTQRLLAFSRQQALAPVALDPNRLVGDMSELIRRTLGEAVAMETVLAGGVWRIFADQNQLENAVLNLAVNARDAMSQGGKLTIETSNTHLDDAYAAAEGVAPGQYVAICVTDTGEGMTAEVIEKVFEPFFTTKPAGQGSGLGLSQVYGFVKQSNGHVKIYSEPGAGTTVKIYLPRTMDAETQVTPQGTQPMPLGDGSSVVLVVEDDANVRSLTVDMLRRLNYRVLSSNDGTAALRVLEDHPEVALLFTDVGLPGQYNGRQLADAAKERWPTLRVLFTTGYARNAIVHHGRLDPGLDLIVKPFSQAALAQKVQLVLSA